MIVRLVSVCGLVLALVSSFATTSTAQLAQGELRGIVTDESGAVLPGLTSPPSTSRPA